ncbi:MAG: hypothetical protein IPK03_10335 [Bacteroidetes bacterium]|nr:hypothetical protein [Bacteroidota bacterium]
MECNKYQFAKNIYIKVRDNQNNCRKDVSNAPNSIIPAQPILTSPNGGEVWKVNSNQNITWNTATFYSSVVIEFSPDGGSNWNTVATVANTGSYSWTVPNAITSTCIIRVSNNGNPSLFDTSNANFTINLPAPIITSPNGGETFTSMNSTNITWDASSVASNVKIEYSLDSGNNWTLLVASTSNTGTYPWTLPMIQENRVALIRLTNVSFPSAIDYSDAVFNIRPPVYVSVLNNITTLTACSTLNINWQRTSNANYNNYSSSDAAPSYRGKYELYYKLDNGAWTNFATEENYQTTTSYSYPLVIPDNPGSTIKVMVIAKYNTQTYGSPAPNFWVDSSNAFANIVPPTGTITVTAPNGGINLNANTNYNITWTASGASGFYDLGWSTSATSGFNLIASNISGNNYNWAVPNMNSASIFIKIRDYNNNCRKDASNAANAVIPAQPLLTSPNGGEVWTVNSSKVLRGILQVFILQS